MVLQPSPIKTVQSPVAFKETPAPSPFPWRRLSIGLLYVSLGLGAIALSAGAIAYRLTHWVSDDGIINTSTIRLRAPMDGVLSEFYARPGVRSLKHQVLAKIHRSPEVDQTLLKLQGEVESKKVQLEGVQATIATLEQELHTLELQQQSWQAMDRQQLSVEVSQAQADLEVAEREAEQAGLAYRQATESQMDEGIIAQSSLMEAQATLDRAIAEEQAAAANYQRYQKLLQEGAISQEKTDQVKLTWESAIAQVKTDQAAVNRAEKVLQVSQTRITTHLEQLQLSYQAAQAKVTQAQAQLEAVQNRFKGIPAPELRETARLSPNYSSVLHQARQLRQDLQTYIKQANLLTVELNNAQQQLKDIQAAYTNGKDLEIKAPIAGVIYQTEREAGEQVKKDESLLTILDCNQLWVETFVPAKKAIHINPQTPVLVKLTGSDRPILGEIELMQGMGNSLTESDTANLSQTQAISPVIPSHLSGKPVVRITVRISPQPEWEHPMHSQKQFCGVNTPAQLTFPLNRSWPWSP